MVDCVVITSGENECKECSSVVEDGTEENVFDVYRLDRVGIRYVDVGLVGLMSIWLVFERN